MTNGVLTVLSIRLRVNHRAFSLPAPTAVNALMMRLKCIYNPNFWNFFYIQRLIIKILCSDTLDIFIGAFSRCVCHTFKILASHTFSLFEPTNPSSPRVSAPLDALSSQVPPSSYYVGTI